MRKLHSIVAICLATVVATSMLTTAAHATGAPPRSDLSIGLGPQDGIQARVQAAQALYDLSLAPPAHQSRRISRALRYVTKATEHVAGDSIVDIDGFNDDKSAVSSLVGARGSSPAVPPILAGLVEADRIAVVRAWEIFTSLDQVEVCGAPPAGEEPCRVVLDSFWRAYNKGVGAQLKPDEVKAVTWFAKAWHILDAQLGEYAVNADGDDDVLPADRERLLGTDPAVADTDGDGIDDSVELLTTFTDPTLVATYDGIADPELDLDGDGLDTLAELSAGTDPVEPDTDGDGLPDGSEGGPQIPGAFGSDPLRADTDGDGLDDGSEQRLGTDPRNPDTDGDGVQDGTEIYTSSVTAPEVDVSVSLTGVGDVAETVVATSQAAEPLWQDMPGMLGEPVNLDAELPFTSADVTFSFDPATVPDNDLGNVAIGRYDEATGLLTPLPTIVDAQAGTATATTPGFSIFVLFYVPTWQAVFTTTVPTGGGTGGDTLLDVVITLDSSGSMTTNDPLNLRLTSAQSFVNALIPGDRAAVVDFDLVASTTQALTEDRALVNAAISRIDAAGGGTSVQAGVAAALDELDSNNIPANKRVVILLTDGENAGVGPYPPELTQRAVDSDTVIFTIALGASTDEALLQSIAAATGGQFFLVANASDLPAVFDRLATGSGADTDGDGLFDSWELQGMPTGSGRRVFADPTNPDSDGDGVTDGDEVVRQQSTVGTGIYFQLLGNPQSADSDGDGLSDREEIDMETNALRRDMDSDGASDGEEYARGWELTARNPDGDSLDDGEELQFGRDAFVFDLTFADEGRAFLSGLVLGEWAYWYADRGRNVTVRIAFTPRPVIVPYPADLPGIDDEALNEIIRAGLPGLDLCGTALFGCDELLLFRPAYISSVAFFIGLLVPSFLPVVDILVTIRDTVAAFAQGEIVAGGLEATFGTLGVAAPLLGDIPNVGKDLGKWANRVAGTRGANRFIRQMASDTNISDDVFLDLLRITNPAALNTLRSAAVPDAPISTTNLRRLASGPVGQLDNIAAAVNNGAVVRRAPQFFDQNAGFGSFGKEAEDYLNFVEGGVQQRLFQVDGVGPKRYVDNVVVGADETLLQEVKTGDSRRDRVIGQIRKDSRLLQSGAEIRVEWHFFPSARGNKLGPPPSTAAELTNNQITIVVWLP